MQFSQPFHEPTTGTHSQPPPPRYFDQALEAAAARRVAEELDDPEVARALSKSGSSEAESDCVRAESGASQEAAPAAEVQRTQLFAQLDLHTESNFFVGFSGDLADGGLFITSYQPLSVGEAVQVELCLSGRFVSVSGRVVWRRVPHPGRLDLAPGAGIVLDALNPALRSHIANFMQRREPWFVDDEVLPLDASTSSEPEAPAERKVEATVGEKVVQPVEAQEPDPGQSAVRLAAAPLEAGREVSAAPPAPKAASASQGKSRRPGRKQRRGRGRRNTKH